MKRVFWFILAGCTAMLLLAACNGAAGGNNAATSDEAGAVVRETEAPVSTYDIATKFVTLRYPEKWKDKVKTAVKEDGAYTVSFAYGETPLFDLLFNGEEGNLLGTVQSESGSAVVRIKEYTLDSKAKDYPSMVAAVSDVNVIIDCLERDYQLDRNADSVADNSKVFPIQASPVTLYYPEKWKDEVTVETAEGEVRFSCGDQKLFDVLFGSDKGDRVGSYKGETVSIMLYDLHTEGLSEAQQTKLRGMREDVNVILDHLAEDTSFSRK